MTEAPIVVGLSGASGIRLGVETVEALSEHVPVHTIVTQGARSVMRHESRAESATMESIETASEQVYEGSERAAPLASGTVETAGMVVVPASMKSVAAIANGYAQNLLVRAADVTLKEDRQLVVVPRESPLNEAHLENLLALRKRGVAIVPPMLGFYYEPDDLQAMVDRNVGTVLDRFGLDHDLYQAWSPD